MAAGTASTEKSSAGDSGRDPAGIGAAPGIGAPRAEKRLASSSSMH
jgi:hypothetical protein